MALGLSLAILWILVAYKELAHVNLEFAESKPAEDASRHENSLSKENFIAEAMSSAAEDDFNSYYIRAMCDAQEWDPTVVFTCHGVIGGTGTAVHLGKFFL